MLQNLHFNQTRGSWKSMCCSPMYMYMCIFNKGPSLTLQTRIELITNISVLLILSCWSFCLFLSSLVLALLSTQKRVKEIPYSIKGYHFYKEWLSINYIIRNWLHCRTCLVDHCNFKVYIYDIRQKPPKK